MKFVFLNESFVPASSASVSVKDLGLQRGYAVFDFVRLIGDSPLFLDDHLDRFYNSAETLRLNVPYQREALKHIVTELIRRNDAPNSGIKLTLTGGNSEDGVTPGYPNFFLSQHSFSTPTEAKIAKGIRLMTVNHQRQLPHVKTIDYLMAVYTAPLLIDAGADEMLYHNNGVISESPRSNFFAVFPGELIVTPKANVLHGITRKKVIEMASAQFQIEERALTLDELQHAEEAFITSTSKQILPVHSVDDKIFGSTSFSRKLLQLFRQSLPD